MPGLLIACCSTSSLGKLSMRERNRDKVETLTLDQFKRRLKKGQELRCNFKKKLNDKGEWKPARCAMPGRYFKIAAVTDTHILMDSMYEPFDRWEFPLPIQPGNVFGFQRQFDGDQKWDHVFLTHDTTAKTTIMYEFRRASY